MATPEAPDNPFWSFSLAVYGRPQVSEACLALQEAAGLDVNLLLFALWAGSCGRSLGAADFALLLGRSAAWQVEVVRPLRAVRRRLKGAGAAAEALRQRIKRDELQAERLEQDLLNAALPLSPKARPGPRDRAKAEANLGACLALYLPRPGARERALLEPLLAAAFPA